MNLFVYKLLQVGFDTQTYNWFISSASDYAISKICCSNSYLGKCNALYTDALLKKCCKNVYHYLYDKSDITTNKFGKPYFKSNSIFFNISHSGRYAALAVSQYPVGVDVEDNVKMIDKRVINVIDKKDSNIEDNSAFKILKLWTAKESFLKGLGVGMTYPVDRVSYIEENNTISIKNRVKNIWSVTQIFSNKYVVSVASPKAIGIQFHLIKRLDGLIN